MADHVIESQCLVIIESLQRSDLSHEDRRKLTLEAEVLPFGGKEAAALAPLLRKFIEDYRDSNVPADLVAVGSAIRNFIATAPAEDAFGAAAGLLKAEGRLALPIELEVEITKMVVRKLTANPPASQDQYPELASRLIELGETYLNPRLIAREKHGAVALNALLGIVLTRDPRASRIIQRVQTLGVPWFQTLLGRRAARLLSELPAREVDAEFADVVRNLRQLSDLGSSILAS